MIHYICRDGQQDTVVPFLVSEHAALRDVLRVTTYERIFSRASLSPGHLVFTDVDLLSPPELEAAQKVAERFKAVLPGATIFNEPARVLQRYALLSVLWRENINPFRAARLDDGVPELRYPVFIRREDGAEGPETGLLSSREELLNAIERLSAAGLPLRGRIAVEYCAERCERGYFRKYGAFRIGPHILPQHMLLSSQWMVKQNTSVITPESVAEEERYMAENAHRAALMAVFERANVQFGRIDYGFVGNRLVVYEINTNPTFPHGDHRNGREHLRYAARRRIVEVLGEMNRPLAATGPVRYEPPSTRPAGDSPWRSFQLAGRSAFLDRILGVYWRLVPESLRRAMPPSFKKYMLQVIARAVPRKDG